MTTGPGVLALLVLAGVGAGLTGSVAGLASLVSYPALLAAGLPPVLANVTNTTAMFGNVVGATAGSLPELRGQGRRLVPLCALCALGGIGGGALLLHTPSAFEAAVPWLIALASVLLLAGPRLRTLASERAAGRAREDRVGPGLALGVFAIGVYGGYFGAAAGVMMLALLSMAWTQSLARSNAVKNVVTGAANTVAAVYFALTAPVDWPAAAAVFAGMVVGARLGPVVVRRIPAAPLRLVIAAGGLALAVSLWLRS